MLRKSKLVLAFMPFMLASCGGGAITGTTTYTIKKDGANYTTKVEFSFASKYCFSEQEKSQYEVGGDFNFSKTPFNIEKNFSNEIVALWIVENSRGFITQRSITETYGKVVGFNAKMALMVTDSLKSGDYVKFDYTPSLLKNGTKVCESKLKITLKFCN